MGAKVEIGAGVNAFQFLESKWETEFNIGSGIGVMGQLFVVVESVIVFTEAQGKVPFKALFLPEFKPLQLSAGAHKILHLHLLKLAHAEDKLAGDYFVAESLADLGNPERDLHTAGLHHVQKVHKNTLGGFRTQKDGIGFLADRAHLGGEHQVELPHLRPVART
ncbi:hypothetical protein DSECCO2_401160 [anaerobic digester metagenome]